jgi:sterol desaturase/sphingolipid hydroxylase (fatty acid hydroxylase superfamily)
MRPVDYIALSIPVFFLLIGVELAYARWRREDLYRLNDSVADISTGILDQVLGVFTKAITVGAYALVWERWRVSEWDAASIWTWVICFLGVDFFYYWFHRVSHESNLPWGAHIVHHSSEEFNLSVALRQGALQPLFSFPFYLPLAWLGFPPIVFLAGSSFDTLYQFWIHTRAIKKLGPLDWRWAPSSTAAPGRSAASCCGWRRWPAPRPWSQLVGSRVRPSPLWCSACWGSRR